MTEPASGLVTLLFTDLVDSTELLSRTGDEEAQRIFSAHHELLADAVKNQRDWNYGNAIFHGNMINGLVALKRDNNIGLADGDLLASGRTPGSPQLDSFGPSMKLAKELLAAGERSTVLEFFELCRAFWKSDGGRLDSWSKAVREGAAPDFGPNLSY